MRSSDNKARAFTIADGAGTSRESVHGRYGTRLRLGNYIADIIPDRQDHPKIYHWIVQRAGSTQVMVLGQEATFEAALECGHLCLEALASTHSSNDGAIYDFATTRTIRPGPTAQRFAAHAPSSGLRRRS